MKAINRTIIVTLSVFAIIVTLLLGAALYTSINTNHELHAMRAAEQERVEAEKLDTSYIEKWGGDFADGNIRILGGWSAGTTHDGKQILEDEAGQLWTVEFTSITPDDYLLLWIADNHTPDNMSDDIVLHIWAQVHE